MNVTVSAEFTRDQDVKRGFKSVKEAAANYDRSLLKHAETVVKKAPGKIAISPIFS